MGDLFSGLLQGLAARDELDNNKLQRDLAQKRIGLLAEQASTARTTLELRQKEQELRGELAKLEGLGEGFLDFDSLAEQRPSLKGPGQGKSDINLPNLGISLSREDVESGLAKSLARKESLNRASATVLGQQERNLGAGERLESTQEFKTEQAKLDRLLKVQELKSKERVAKGKNTLAKDKIAAFRERTAAQKVMSAGRAAARIQAAERSATLKASGLEPLGVVIHALENGLPIQKRFPTQEIAAAAQFLQNEDGKVALTPEQMGRFTDLAGVARLVDEFEEFATVGIGKNLFVEGEKGIISKLGKRAEGLVSLQQEQEELGIFLGEIGRLVTAIENQPGSKISDNDIKRVMKLLGEIGDTKGSVATKIASLKKEVRLMLKNQSGSVTNPLQRANVVAPIFGGTFLEHALLSSPGDISQSVGVSDEAEKFAKAQGISVEEAQEVINSLKEN